MEVGTRESAFDDATRQWSERGGRGFGGSSLEKAPAILGELAEYFGTLTLPRLAGCWVACIVHQCYGTELSPGDMARALVVVAERLHGVTFNIAGDPPLTQQGIPTPPAPAKAAPMPRVVGKYEIMTGAAPEPLPRHTRNTEVIAAACALQPGGWFVWTDAAKTCNPKIQTAKLSKAAGFQVIVFRATSGKVIVKRPAP